MGLDAREMRAVADVRVRGAYWRRFPPSNVALIRSIAITLNAAEPLGLCRTECVGCCDGVATVRDAEGGGDAEGGD